MKTNILKVVFASIFIVSACGPAAEDREAMHARAKVFQDSIAFIIRTSMEDAAAPAAGVVVAPDTSKKLIGQGTPTVK
jgi:hypothetical protein